jgi:hypothetical protein
MYYLRKPLNFRNTNRLNIGFLEWFCSREDFYRHSLTALLGGSEHTLTPIIYHSALFQ